MASTTEEVSVPADQPPQEEAANTSSEAAKPRILKRPVKPDEAEYKKQMDALVEQIKRHRDRSDEISRILSGKRTGNETPETKALRTKLSTLRAEWQTTLDQKKAARTELETINKSREAIRVQVKSMKERMKHTTVEKIDEQVQRLEDMLVSSSINLTEEKQVLEQIKQLKASRSTVAEYNQRLTKLTQDDAVREAVVQRIKDADDRLTKLKTEQDEIRAKLDDLRAKETAATADVPALQEERVAAKAVVDAAYAKKSELYADFKARMDAWREEEKAWRVQRDEDRKIRREQQQKEYEERQAARKAQEAEMAGDPFQREINMCDKLTAYLGEYVVKERAGDEGQAGGDAPAAGIDGYTLMGRKKEKELDPMLAGMASKKNKKKGKKKAVLDDEDAADRLLVHSLDVLDSFSRLKLDVPLAVGDVPAALDALVGRRAHFVERQRKKKAGEEDPEDAEDEAREAASSKPKKAGRSKPDLAEHAFPALGSSAAAKGANGAARADEEDEAAEEAADEAAEEDVAQEEDENSSQVDNKVPKQQDVTFKMAVNGSDKVAVELGT